MRFDLRRLRRGEQLAGLGALLLFVFLFFFKWYGVNGFGSVDGWHGHSVLRWLMLLTILSAATLVVLTATQRIVALPVTSAVVTTAIAALTTVLVAYRVVINEPGPNAFVSVKAGAWLGLLACALIFYAGYLSMRDEGTSIADARAQARAAGAQARAAFEAPATPVRPARVRPVPPARAPGASAGDEPTAGDPPSS